MGPAKPKELPTPGLYEGRNDKESKKIVGAESHLCDPTYKL